MRRLEMRRSRMMVLAGIVVAGVMGISYWRGSKPYLLRASHEVAAPRDVASATILAPATLPKYFPDVREVEADPAWPAVGSYMRWTIGTGGGMVFRARVRENSLPESIVLDGETPSGNSVITHRFTALGEGATLYEKVVEIHYRGWSRIVGPLLTLVIERSLTQEVERAAAAVTEHP
jgi:hypothetical protein